jgi:hypothetical protein
MKKFIVNVVFIIILILCIIWDIDILNRNYWIAIFPLILCSIGLILHIIGAINNFPKVR